MVKKVGTNTVGEARQEKHVYGRSSSSRRHCHLTWWEIIVLVLMLAIGLVLYMQFLLDDIQQMVFFPGYLFPTNSTTADKLDYSEENSHTSGGLKGAVLAPVPTSIPGPDNSNVTATQSRDNSGSKNVSAQNTQQGVQDPGDITKPSTSLPPAPTVKDIPDGDHDHSDSTTTEPKDVQNGSLENSTASPDPVPGAIPGAIPGGRDSSSTTTQPMDFRDESRVGNSTTAHRSSGEKFSVLVGVFILAYEMQRRDIIRLAYRVQSSEYADFTVRFILGGYQLETWLEGENATHGDMIVLQCTENLNEGKSFVFFSSLPDMGLQYDYVMKTDDDSYVRLGNLGRHLQAFSRSDLYYGYSLPCDSDGPPADFRVGAGYMMSWDLVLWIRDSPIPRNHTIGIEDQLVGEWFREGQVARTRPSSLHLFHDHPEQGGECAKQLTTQSILIHKLKTDERWYEVIDFYNVSRSLNN